MRIVWSEHAVADLKNIAEYLERQQSLATANRIWRIIYDTVQTLRRFPYRGRDGRVDHTRETGGSPSGIGDHNASLDRHLQRRVRANSHPQYRPRRAALAVASTKLPLPQLEPGAMSHVQDKHGPRKDDEENAVRPSISSPVKQLPDRLFE